MFITKKHIPRRLVLRGIGAALSLPFLDSMAPAQERIGKRKSRLACIEMVHGAAGSSDAGKHFWSPAREGADFDFSYTLDPLEPYREHVTIVSGCDARQAEAFSPSEVGADHFRSSAVYLTGARPRQTSGSDVRTGPPIDQIYAQSLAGGDRVPSMQLGIEHVDPTNSCAFDYNCVYRDAISWASPTEPLTPAINPRVVFEQIFGVGDTAVEGNQPASRAGNSVLDAVLPAASRLKNAVGPADRNRLDEFLQDVRDVEKRIEATEARNARSEERERYTAPLGVPDSWEEHVKIMFDLQALAFAAEITRVSSFKMSHDVSNRIFPNSEVLEPFHSLSHHKEAPAQLEKFAKLNRYHVSLIPYFLEKLKRSPDGDGSLLDHTMLLYGSPMGDSETHNHRRVPMFLAGGAGGELKGGLHRVCSEGTPQANLLLTMLRKLGVEQDQIGDSTGEVAI